MNNYNKLNNKLNNNSKVLFLFGKIKHINKAVFYCSLHKCYLSKSDLFTKKFKCKKCKHKKNLDDF